MTVDDWYYLVVELKIWRWIVDVIIEGICFEMSWVDFGEPGETSDLQVTSGRDVAKFLVLEMWSSLMN